MTINKLDPYMLRDLLDDAHISTKKDEDGDLMTMLSADDDFPHDVVIWYILDEGWLTVIARSFEFKMDDPVAVANEYNRTHRGVACTGEPERGTIFFKFGFLIDEEVSSTYVVENCLKFPTSCSWRSFCDIYKSLQ